MSIRKKFIKGAIWNSTAQFGSQALNFIFTIILARLLTPKDFGVLGQVFVFVGFLSFFCEFGLTATMIQKKDLDNEDCNTVFWSLVFCTSIVYIMVYITAPLIASFYNNDNLIMIIRILFIQFLFVPFSMVNEALENKKLQYERIARAEFIGLILSGIGGIVLAYLGFGIWSLVIQAVSRLFFRNVMLLLTTEWRPMFNFSFLRFKIFMKSGMHFTYKNLAQYCNENIDYLLIGKLSGASVLGIYNLAFRISNYPFSKIQAIIGNMLFPAFNIISHDMDYVKKNYLLLTNIGGILLIPLLVAIFFGIDQFISLLVGAKWIASSKIVKILSFYLIFSCISYADEPLMLTLNKIKFINLIKTISSLLLLIIGFFAVSYYSATGMAITLTAISIVSTLIVKITLLKELSISIIKYVKGMRDVFLSGIAFAIILLLYSQGIVILTDSSLLYLVGEVIIFSIFMLVVFLIKGIYNFKTKKINIEAI